MPTRYEDAPEVRALAESVIDDWHPHLRRADIRYVFRLAETDWTAHGRLVLGTARPLSGAAQFLADGAGAVVTINGSMWPGLSHAERMALLDHELSHLGLAIDGDGVPRDDSRGLPVLTSVSHDLQEFRAVVERHGLWDSALRDMAPVMAAQIRQRSLFEDGATAEDESPSDAEEAAPAAGVPLPSTAIEFPDEHAQACAVLLRSAPGYRLLLDDAHWCADLRGAHPTVSLLGAIPDCIEHWTAKDAADDTLNVKHPPRWRQRITGWVQRLDGTAPVRSVRRPDDAQDDAEAVTA